jgi:hypothetical protein
MSPPFIRAHRTAKYANLILGQARTTQDEFPHFNNQTTDRRIATLRLIAIGQSIDQGELPGRKLQVTLLRRTVHSAERSGKARMEVAGSRE